MDFVVVSFNQAQESKTKKRKEENKMITTMYYTNKIEEIKKEIKKIENEILEISTNDSMNERLRPIYIDNRVREIQKLEKNIKTMQTYAESERKAYLREMAFRAQYVHIIANMSEIQIQENLEIIDTALRCNNIEMKDYLSNNDYVFIREMKSKTEELIKAYTLKYSLIPLYKDCEHLEQIWIISEMLKNTVKA